MHFSEIRGIALLTILLTVGIMIADRLAPSGMARPTQTMSTAMRAAEQKAAAARANAEAAAAVRASQAMVNTAPAAPSPLATTILSSGHSCREVRRVVPMSGGDGIYRVICAGPGGDVSYRIDTRRGAAEPMGPVA